MWNAFRNEDKDFTKYKVEFKNKTVKNTAKRAVFFISACCAKAIFMIQKGNFGKGHLCGG